MDVQITNQPQPRHAVHGRALPLEPASNPGVTRRWLEGDERAPSAAAIVRFDPGVRMPLHSHRGTEELLVLEGVLQDERGEYKAGVYIRNPLASQHAPRSDAGCQMLVKRTPANPKDRTAVVLDTAALPLRADPSRCGVHAQRLFFDSQEDVRIERWSAGVDVTIEAPAGLELFVLDGAFDEGGERFEAQSWLRLPAGSALKARAAMEGCRVWMKISSASVGLDLQAR